ncbi:MAG: hypothetical protein U0414_24085 [Polyangiaceae bacterium]
MLLGLALLSSALGCGASSARPAPSGAGARPAAPEAKATRIAVAPPRWATSAPFELECASDALARGLSSMGGVDIVRIDHLDAFDARCEEDAGCIEALARDAGATRLLWTELAALGDTVLVRARLTDLRSSTEEQTLQEVLHDVDAVVLRTGLDRVGARVGKPFAPAPAPLLPPRERPVVEEPGLWVGLGLGTAAAITAVVLGVTLGAAAESPDLVVTPP